MSNDGYLEHYGTPRHSGRYPYGSGENPYQHNSNFLRSVDKYRADGYSEADIAKMMGLKSTTQLRAKISVANDEIRKEEILRCRELREKGYSTDKIAEMTGLSEGTVRNRLKSNAEIKANKTRVIAEDLKRYCDEKRYVDVGIGTELELGCSEERMKTAISLLQDEGYKVQYLSIPQMGTDHNTLMKVLTPGDVTWDELSENRFDIASLSSRVIDEDGVPHPGNKPIENVSSDRIYIRYAEDGGEDKDGVIEIRRGVEDLYLGNARYAQVRVGVDGTHYLKGMAMYGDDIPDGYDIVFNTNKHVGTDKYKVFKEMKKDPDNPFGASFTQKDIPGGNGKTSALCIVNEEGSWDKWNQSLASQMLSKQPVALARRQLDLQYQLKKAEYNDICALTNPTIKRYLLDRFADKCDADAEDLKAAPFPGQASKVILPFPKMKENEIYDPALPDGQEVALIRYPHGGIFEIPILTNKVKGSVAAKTIDRAVDAVGINPIAAKQLSGADFDGDTVLVIPLSDKVQVNHRKYLEGLKDFDPKQFKLPDDKDENGNYIYPKISNQTKQTEMGKVTNLIADMTIKGAKDDEIVRAVKHSMVVIDSEKHHLDYQASEKKFAIAELKKRYQDNGDGKTGASTIITRASSEYDIPVVKRTKPNPITGENERTYSEETYTTGKLKNGEKIYINTDKKTGKMYYNQKDANGKNNRIYISEDDLKPNSLKTAIKTQKSTKMAEIDDAYKLTSGGSKENPGKPIEGVYANFANNMKALANSARKELMSTPKLKSSPTAKKIYAEEVKSLNKQLLISQKNAPKERQAQLLANQLYLAAKNDNPDTDKEHLKRLKGQKLVIARERVGARKPKITITDREWEAIQAGAISDTKLQLILQNTDLKDLQKRATPRYNQGMSQSNINLANTMYANGYSQSEIAARLGVSPSTVSKNIDPSIRK